MSYSPYASEPPQVEKSTNPTNLILVLVVVGFLIFFIADRYGFIEKKPIDGNDDSVVVIDPIDNNDKDQKADPKKDKYAAEDTYVVRVYESDATSEIWLSKQMQNDKFWIKELAERGIDLHTFDPVDRDGKANEQAASFVAAAAKQGISPPFWVHASGGKVLAITPFTENSDQDDWRNIINKSVKE